MKKKCPKCGEENPAEAVMCWACYTPLSSAAAPGVAPGGAAPGAAPGIPGAMEEGEKKQIPPWQLGLIGGAVLLGVFVGVRAMMPASGSGDEVGNDIPTTMPSDGGGGRGGGGSAPPSPPSPSGNPPAGGGGAVTPEEAPFTIVVPPNPKISVATMAILPKEGTTSGPQAASYAAYVRRQYAAQTKNWNTLYIYVFSDAQSSQFFADYMKKRKGETLSQGDYSALVTLWPSALARYEYSVSKGKRVERVLYPSKNPNGWWQTS